MTKSVEVAARNNPILVWVITTRMLETARKRTVTSTLTQVCRVLTLSLSAQNWGNSERGLVSHSCGNQPSRSSITIDALIQERQSPDRKGVRR